jgi:hypothetical protein
MRRQRFALHCEIKSLEVRNNMRLDPGFESLPAEKAGALGDDEFPA